MKKIDFSNIAIKELASFIYETLKRDNIDAVLVGGACVSIYSDNRYQSSDLDFVTYEPISLNFSSIFWIILADFHPFAWG